MGEKFDPYRDALVVETNTLWPDDLPTLDAAERARIEAQLHAQPQQAADLAYIRLYTGFQRQITVTPADLERLK
jgi:hypothetical protein